MNDKTTYSLIVNSTDKLSGNNHDAKYQINWNDFLPEKYDKFKVSFTAQTAGGYYVDGSGSSDLYSCAKLLVDFNCRQFCWDTSQKCQSTCMGFLQRDTLSTSNFLYALHGSNSSRCISKPNTNILNVKFINQTNGDLMVETDDDGNEEDDMTSYTIIFEFKPIE